MKYRFQEARVAADLSANELAAKMKISRSTVSNWESERRQPTLKDIERMAKILGVSVAFLLGEDTGIPSFVKPVSKKILPTLHRCPVWIPGHGWALVNSIEKNFIFSDKKVIAFHEITEHFYTVPPAFSLAMRGTGDPLSVDELCIKENIWVEPISQDAKLCDELRGWYRPSAESRVENEFGNRFYMDTYGSKWLAFENWK